MIEIHVLRLDVGTSAVREADVLLSCDELKRAHRFARTRDSRRYSVARAALRRHLGARLGVAPQSIEFAYGAHGKPSLAGQHAATGLRFNVSYAGEVAAFAFTTGCEVGVDIEALRAMPDAARITHGLASPTERRAWESLAPGQRLHGFFNWWTRKEAFVKACGGGLSMPLDAFDVSFAPGVSARLLRCGDVAGERAAWTLRAFTPAPDVIGAVAFAGGETEVETHVARD